MMAGKPRRTRHHCPSDLLDPQPKGKRKHLDLSEGKLNPKRMKLMKKQPFISLFLLLLKKNKEKTSGTPGRFLQNFRNEPEKSSKVSAPLGFKHLSAIVTTD